MCLLDWEWGCVLAAGREKEEEQGSERGQEWECSSGSYNGRKGQQKECDGG
jgi:hypothetical protein